MSAKNNSVRWISMIMVVIILGVLVWQFTPDGYVYMSAVIAAALALAAGILIFRSNTAKPAKTLVKAKVEAEAPANDELAFDPNLDPQDYRNAEERMAGYRESKPRLPATEVAARYMQMAAAAKAAEEATMWKPYAHSTGSSEGAGTAVAEAEPAAQASSAEQALAEAEAVTAAASVEPPMPLIVDESTLAEEEKIQLENAAWYRCENPYCKYTHFLEVHHIVDEKDGGNNKLENLIVFCPYCHELAHKGEIPEKEMRDWIANRDERFRAKLTWRY